MLGFIFLFVMSPVLAIPDGYILHVNPSCGATTSDQTTITVISDMDTAALANCKDTPNPRPVHFTEVNNVVRRISVETEGSSSDCLFYKKDEAKIFTIEIEVSYGQPGAYVHMQSETYLITCTYDRKGLNIEESASRLITDAYIQPMELSNNVGEDSNATFDLQLIDVLGRPITGNVPIGRMVRLKGTLSGGTGNEPGFRAVSCMTSAGGSTFAVLRGGCGDGVVFSKHDGFSTKGQFVYSPYFGAFRIDSHSDVQFTCNFTVCTTNCDGTSCPHSRKKRDATNALLDTYSGNQVESSTGRLKIHTPVCQPINEYIDHDKGIVQAQRPSQKQEIPQYFWTGSIVLGVFAIMTLCVTIICFSQWQNKHREFELRQSCPLKLTSASDP